MKVLLMVIFGLTFTTSYGQKSNWTKTDEVNFKSDCKRGLKDSKSTLTNEQQDEYCDCIFNKIKSNFPDKYAQVPPNDWMKTKAKECLKTIIYK
jgi:hypothetical protein